MDRVWGGRSLETKLHRKLPADRPIGESWELVDREEVQSVVNHGDLAGTTLLFSVRLLWVDSPAPEAAKPAAPAAAPKPAAK